MTNGYHSYPDKIILRPNKDRGCSTVRFRKLQSSRGKRTGLPLDHKGISYNDQDTSKFEDARSVVIGFYSPRGKRVCALQSPKNDMT